MLKETSRNGSKIQLPDEKSKDLTACCETCSFFFLDKEKVPTGGLCRSRPPQTVSIPAMVQTLQGQQMSVQIHSIFPAMQRDDWCGDHPVRKAETAADQFMNMLDILATDSPGMKSMLESVGIHFDVTSEGQDG